MNRYELYDKSRPKPSKASIHRVNSVKINIIHPLLLGFVTDDQIQLEKAKEEIHSYRPTATIWEVERGRGKSEVVFIILKSLSFIDDGEEEANAPVVHRKEQGR